VRIRVITDLEGAAMDPQADVLVLDRHGTGGIAYELLHEHAELISGRGYAWPAGFDPSVTALFLVGQHAMAGTPEAPLAHTMSSRTIEYLKLNGRLVGEFGRHAYMAGTLYGIPTAFLSGDDKAVAEAQALVPDLVGVITKYGLALEAARSLSPARARALIRAGAAEACRRVQAGQIAPVRLEPPYWLEVRVLPGQEAALTGYLRRGAKRVDDRTAILHTDDPLRLWR
jgi:D-amino peptidase